MPTAKRRMKELRGTRTALTPAYAAGRGIPARFRPSPAPMPRSETRKKGSRADAAGADARHRARIRPLAEAPRDGEQDGVVPEFLEELVEGDEGVASLADEDEDHEAAYAADVREGSAGRVYAGALRRQPQDAGPGEAEAEAEGQGGGIHEWQGEVARVREIEGPDRSAKGDRIDAEEGEALQRRSKPIRPGRRGG
jgi:hypothetical protein